MKASGYRGAVLYLRAYIPTGRILEVVGALGEVDEVRHVVRMGSSASGDFELISADVCTRSEPPTKGRLDRYPADALASRLGRSILFGEGGHVDDVVGVAVMTRVKSGKTNKWFGRTIFFRPEKRSRCTAPAVAGPVSPRP